MSVHDIEELYWKPLPSLNTKNGGAAYVCGKTKELYVSPQLAFTDLEALFTAGGQYNRHS